MELCKLNINNDELKQFFDNIIDTITYFIDTEEQSITINFIYNGMTFNLYKDYDTNKLSITNKYYYEFFYDNYEYILINRCNMKNVTINDVDDFLQQLFLFINNI